VQDYCSKVAHIICSGPYTIQDGILTEQEGLDNLLDYVLHPNDSKTKKRGSQAKYNAQKQSIRDGVKGLKDKEAQRVSITIGGNAVLLSTAASAFFLMTLTQIQDVVSLAMKVLPNRKRASKLFLTPRDRAVLELQRSKVRKGPSRLSVQLNEVKKIIKNLQEQAEDSEKVGARAAA
jgi:hypothetical protein